MTTKTQLVREVSGEPAVPVPAATRAARDMALVQVMADAGLRRSEAAGILAERLAPGPAIEDLATPVMPSAAVLRTEKGRAGCPASR